MDHKSRATEEQIAYAKVEDVGMKIGLVAITVTFIIYLSGILSPHIPISLLPKYWTMPVKQYLKATGIHQGWSWLGLVGEGDFLNLLGIAFLAGLTIVCFLRIIPILFKKKDTTYGIIAIVEVIVLVLAASGILKSGGH
jgi:hypothetical protein